jgi:hypothetical protein
MKKLFALLALLSSGAVQAAPVTIDFEEFVASGPDNPVTEPFTSKGFEFSVVGGDDPAFFVELNSLPSISFAWCPTCTLTVATDNGSLFSATSVLLLDTGFDPIGITGYLEGGGTVQILHVPNALETVIFGTEWNNLEKVEFSGTNGLGSVMDNLVVEAVPIPAAVWLFGSALAGLGWLRRRQTA